MGLTKSSWDIEVHVNITSYTAAMAVIEETMSVFDAMIAKESVMRPEMQTVYHRILNMNELIMSSVPQRRLKRAPLSFIGSMYHSLFGLMDEEHAEVLSQRIKNVDKNQKHLMDLAKNYSSIQDITSEVIKKQNEVIFSNLKKFQGSFDTLAARVNGLSKVEKVTQLLSMMESFEEVQKNLIGVMTNSKGSLLHDILPVMKLKEEILRIKEHVSKKLQMPTQKSIELAKLAYVTTRTTSEFILFNVRLPLISLDIFTAYAIHTYPILHDEMPVKIIQKIRYMLIDGRKTMFYYMDVESYTKCQKTNDMMICPQLHPVYNTRTQSCEVLLFLKTRKMPGDCKVEIKAWENYWKQIRAPNTWIFSVPTKMTAAATCQGKRRFETIEGQGLIKMKPDCHLETEETNLWAYGRYSSD
ncbi:uncharacterized protein LOC142225051 [Haematobia irritans]|uniref:uncharacterized protein LOC142225051 n=1 Tax=Haematobia irritans TaxID=7368 RepID=UPI003F4FC3F0